VLDAATGEVVEKGTYLAYGSADSDYRPTRWDSFREDHRFTGKEEDVELGLSYFGKRFLVMALGRWASPDPLSVHGLGADSNLYAYVHGRLLGATDPAGLADSKPMPKPGDEDEIDAHNAWLMTPHQGPVSSVQGDEEAKAFQSRFAAAVSAGVAAGSVPDSVRDLAISEARQKAETRAHGAEVSALAEAIDADSPQGAWSHVPLVGSLGYAYANANHGKFFAAGLHLAVAASDVSLVESVGKLTLKAIGAGIGWSAAALGHVATDLGSEAAEGATSISSGTGMGGGGGRASLLDLFKPTQTARRFDFAKAQQYADMMRLPEGTPGAWDWSLDKIIVDAEGNIMSGHHRVLAAEIARLPGIPESAIYRFGGVSGRPVYQWSDILRGTGVLGF
jgi:RHS repeat-associated protein